MRVVLGKIVRWARRVGKARECAGAWRIWEKGDGCMSIEQIGLGWITVV